jgi:chemotaxis protein MotB
MYRKKISIEDSTNHDRWLVSYADFITLLFAFFVVMYASSSVNKSKYNAVSLSISSAFQKEHIKSLGDSGKEYKDPIELKSALENKGSNELILIDPIVVSKINQGKQVQARDRAKLIKSELMLKLKPLLDQGKISISQTPKGIRIDIQESFLFKPGSSRLADTAPLETLVLIAPILINAGNAIEIEGHTDNTPIKNKDYESNWELSALRATTVLRILNNIGVPDELLSATGFGSSRPLVQNSTAENRAKNRRVSIYLLQ